jgi:hypothetical protein
MPKAIKHPWREKMALGLANEHLATVQQHAARIGVQKGYDRGFRVGFGAGVTLCWVAFFVISFFVWLFW